MMHKNLHDVGLNELFENKKNIIEMYIYHVLPVMHNNIYRQGRI